MKKICEKAFTNAKQFVLHNLLFLIFVIINVLGTCLMRYFTLKSFFSIMPVLADTALIIFIGMFSMLMKPKRSYIYLLVWTIVLTILTFANTVYYSNFKQFLSISLISTASQLGGVTDAVFNIIEWQFLLLLLTIPVMIAAQWLLKRKGYYEHLPEKAVRKKTATKTAFVTVGMLVVFVVSLNSTDFSRLAKQWNREYVVSRFGMITYHISDAVSSARAKLNVVFGYEKNRDKFDEFYKNKKEQEKDDSTQNGYTDIFKGKNVLVIHAESIQQFTMDTYMNGEELTPNLNKLAHEGLYFSNFYAQESVGTSSDTEFTFSTSLMPAASGTVAINYWNRDYTSIQKLFKGLGYYVFSMHGNKGSYWNRENFHASLGYDRFFSGTSDYEIDEVIGLGLSDKSFFSQSISKIQTISQQNKNFYGLMIMLTNHTPFTGIEEVSDYPVDFEYKKYNEETSLYEEVSAPFMEGTKLGSYFKSVHYADEALGQFISDLDSVGLLDNTVIVLYGDHDAKIKESEYEYYYNYNPFTDTVLTEDDPGYIPVDEYYYNLNRKVPFIIWTKDHAEYTPREITRVMGMYDALPTLGNMFGFEDEYALGTDIFSLDEDKENIVVMPNGNFITDTVYYNSQEDKYFDLTDYQNVAEFASCNQAYKQYKSPIYQESRDGKYKSGPSGLGEDAVEERIDNGVVTDDYITERTKYAEERISISNAIIYYDMIKKESEDSGTDSSGTGTQTDVTTVSGAAADSKTASQDNAVTTTAS